MRSVPRASQFLLALLLVFGVGLRVVAYLQNRPFWRDESALALEVQRLSYYGLFSSPHTPSPIGFLVAVKALVERFGSQEWVFRLIPFMSSVIALVLLAVLFFLWMKPKGALLGVALAVFSERAVYYAGEFKHYELDLMWTVCLLCGYEYVKRRHTRGAYLGIALMGAVAVWMSYSAALVLAGIGVVLLWDAVSNRRHILNSLGLGLFWILNIAANASLAMAHQMNMQGLHTFWGDSRYQAFMPLGSFWNAVTWLPTASFGVVRYLFGLPIDMLKSKSYSLGFGLNQLGFSYSYLQIYQFFILAVVLLGIGRMIMSKHRLAFSILGFTVLAAVVQKYPFYGRFTLFLLPLFILIVVKAVQKIEGKSWAPAVVAGLLLHPMLICALESVNPKVMTDTRALVHHFSEHRFQGEPLLALQNPNLIYYAQEAHLVHGQDYILFNTQEELEKEVLSAPLGKTCWVLYLLNDRSKTAMSPEAEKTLMFLKKNTMVDQDFRAIGNGLVHCKRVGVL